MHVTAKITSKGQTTLPVEVRTKLGVKPGDHVRYTEMDDGGVRIEKLPSSFDDLHGIIKLDRPLSDEDLAAAIDRARMALGGLIDRD